MPYYSYRRQIEHILRCLTEFNSSLNYKKMNGLKTRLFLSIDPISKSSNQRCSVVQSGISIYFQRSICISHVLNTKKGAGKEQGRMKPEALQKMVENEERGVFRKLELGVPEQWNSTFDKKKRADRAAVMAASR